MIFLLVGSCDSCGPKGEISCGIQDEFGNPGGGSSWGPGSGGAPSCDDLCGVRCCNAFEVCAEDTCVALDDSCQSTRDCDPGRVCSFGLDGDAITAHPTGVEVPLCPSPPLGLCVPGAATANACVLAPSEAPELPTIVAASGDPLAPDAADSILGTLAVLPVADGNCDYVTDAQDPGTIFSVTATQSGTGSHGTLQAHSLGPDGLTLHWSTQSDPPDDPTASIAVFRQLNTARIYTCTTDERVRAYDDQGQELWLGPPSTRCDSITLGDSVGNGTPILLTESQALDPLKGKELFSMAALPSHGVIFTRLGGGPPRIVTANRILSGTGELVIDAGLAEGFVATSDDAIYAVDPVASELHRWHLENGAAVVDWTIDLAADFTGSCPPGTLSGGPPAVVPLAEGSQILVSTALGPIAVDDQGVVLWATDAPACAEGTAGITAHDVDGDQRIDVLRQAADHLEIFAGDDGALLASRCLTAEVGPHHPLVADLDGDGFGELLAAASSRAGTTCEGASHAGLVVLDTPTSTLRTRPTHPQFSYLAGAFEDDGQLATDVVDHGTRINPTTADAPDVTLELERECSLDGLRVRVVNRGRAVLGAGQALLVVRELAGDFSATAPLNVSLAPGASAVVEAPDAPSGDLVVQVTTPDGDPLGECNLDPPLSVTCP
ncbi:MAG: VCBS repeat-containing protein [Polyangiaceae bacterium]